MATEQLSINNGEHYALSLLMPRIRISMSRMATIALSLSKNAEAVKSATSLRKLIDQEKKKIPPWATEDAEKFLAVFQ